MEAIFKNLRLILIPKLQEEIGRFRINYSFKIIYGISNYGGHFLKYLIKLEFYNQDRFEKLSLLISWVFFADRVIYFWNKLPNKIMNRYSVEILKLHWMNSKNYGKKKKFKWAFLGTIRWII